MAISVPNENLPSGDLARTVNHEMDTSWPELIEIVAYFGPGRTKRKSVAISADQFFGRGGYNAPITMDQLLLIINRLRKGDSK